MKTQKQVLYALTLCMTLFLSALAHAQSAIIVHPSNTYALTDTDIEKLYTGRISKFPDGYNAIALDRTEGSAIRVAFVEKLLGKSEAQLKSYWARLIFTGKGVPPRVAATDQEVIDLVSRNQDAIGFVDAASVTAAVKVVKTF